MRASATIYVVAAVVASGCAGDGCSCMSDIPGGFPAEARQENAIQARLSSTGVDALADNAGALVDAMFPDGLSFPVPPTCGSDRKVCCGVPTGYCEMLFDMDPYPGDPPRLELVPLGDNRAELVLRARVRTARPMPVAQAGLFGDINCSLSVDTRWSGTPHITLVAQLAFEQDPATGTTRIAVDDSQLYNLSSGDLSIDGGLLCGLANEGDAAAAMQAQFAQQIPGAIEDFVCTECATDADCKTGACAGGVCTLDDAFGRRCVHEIGTEGRLAAQAILGSLAPAAESRDLDIYLALGGFAEAIDDGLSLGVLGGAMPADTSAGNPCVPVVAEPARQSIPQSVALADNVHPHTGEAFDIGLGIHASHLDRMAWAAHQAGYLCLDLGAARIPLLNTGALAILAPSMLDLVHGEDAPLFLSIRPQQPPTLAPGRGTFTDDGEVDEAVLTVRMTDLEIDFYALVDQRYVRLLTLRADLEAPIGLMTNALGNVELVLGDMADALGNLRVSNSELLAETEQELIDKFPAVLSVALPRLGDSLGDGDGIALPDFAGLTLDIGEMGFTAVDDGAFLAIFGDLRPATPAKLASVDTRAEVVQVRLPEAAAFSAPRLDPDEQPVVELALGGARADGASANLEWQVRVDRGFWSPFSRQPRLALSRQAFWLQGRHTIEVRAREIGAPRTLDPEPVALEVLIDTVAPRLTLDRTADGVSVDATDLVSPAEALAVRYRVDGGDWLAAGAPPVALAVDGAAIEVEVVDEAGNAATDAIVGFHGKAQSSGCGCSTGGDDAGGLALLVLAVAGWLGRKRLPLALGAIALFGVVACGKGEISGDGGGGDDGTMEPTEVIPGPTGRWQDIAADGERVVISAYEEKLGDLVVGEVAADGAVTFTPIAGVPDVAPSFDPDGYRGGIKQPGDDVGAWTSVALHGGLARVAYQHRDTGALWLGVEDQAGAWTHHEVDPADGGEVMYTSLAIDGDGAVAIAYMVHAIALEDGGFDAELRLARADGDAWTVTTVDRVRIPCTGLCGDGVCVAESDTCAVEEDTCGGDVCAEGAACVAGACAEIRPTPEAADLPEGIGLFASTGFTGDGRLAIAYYDRVNADLYLALEDPDAETGWARVPLSVDPQVDRGQWASLAVDGQGALHVAFQDAMDDSLRLYTWQDGELSPAHVIDGGARDGDRPHPVGASAQLVITPDGALAVAYQDSATADLLIARGTPDGTWTRDDLLAGPEGYGFYTAAAADARGVWVSTYVYDHSVWPPGKTVVTRVE